uniref:Uncharacterized protein n=1 Tax=Haemonchus contortus TaxID=6289 RepID=A0A7I4YSC5_HAECO
MPTGQELTRTSKLLCDTAPNALQSPNFRSRPPSHLGLDPMGPGLESTSIALAHTKERFFVESQFNKHHGARKRVFSAGDPVLARQYHGNREEWSSGKVLKRVGKVLYRVLIGNKVCVRHANQLRLRYYDDATAQRQDIDTLLQMFDLPQQSTPSFQSASLSPEQTQHTEQAPSMDNSHVYQPRRSTRTRRPTTRLQVDPRQKTYRQL